ncbi:hypothetical protein [Streptosporangium sp. NPDC002607]
MRADVAGGGATGRDCYVLVQRHHGELLLGWSLGPEWRTIYRALAEHDKAQAYPDAVAQAHSEFAELATGT